MKDNWYSDNRDLVKWGVLLRLAEAHNIATILQVAYYRRTSWDGKDLQIDGQRYPLPSAVLDHFRKIGNIAALKAKANVIVLDTPCDDRTAYLQHVLTRVRSQPERPKIVFLDPDTGLEPKRKAGPQHVRGEELRAIWDALQPNDLLVLYQHRTRSRSWLAEKQTQFETALGLESGSSKVAQGKEIAADVAFFYRQNLPNASLRSELRGGSGEGGRMS